MMDPNSNIVPTMLTYKEANSEMIGAKFNSIHVNRRSRPYYHRSCKGKSSSKNIESLPDELLFQILLQLPGEDIYKGARFVCKKWHNTIHNRSFVYARLQRLTTGLLIQSCGQRENLVYLAMRQGRIEISKLTYKFKGIIWAGCNGLIVEPDSFEIYSPYITNPATKQRLALPPVSRKKVPMYYSVIAYDVSSMRYKAVLNYTVKNKSSPINNCAILTMGVDKSWRRVHTEHLSIGARLLLTRVPLTTLGFVHWTHINGNNVVTLNVETEIITETLVPHCYGERIKYYLSTGMSLTLLVECSDFSWEVLKMKPETGEWTKLPKIDLEPHKGKFVNLFRECPFYWLEPVGWLNYQEALVLHAYLTGLCIVYNVHTQEMDFLESYSELCSFKVHRNSSVPLGRLE